MNIIHMNVIDIIYARYFTPDGTNLSIGGVETYITQLARLAHSMGLAVRIFQFADNDFVNKIETSIVYGFKHKGDIHDGYLLQRAKESYQSGNKYLTIIANDNLIPNYKVENSIVIQHGIGFDSCFGKNEPLWIDFIKRQKLAYSIVKALENVDEVVCVDNNFICWYRTQTSLRNIKLTPILNFTEIGSRTVKKSHSPVKILFARRFVEIRGTRLFTPVVKRLLDKYSDIEITFAGKGPDEYYIKETLKGYDRVNFTSYEYDKSIEFHSEYNISVVPTIFSEGTSLSLLEAMSAHCAVVCTNIGGMTNIILDGYNGLMVTPNHDELYNAISILIEDSNFREQIAERAYDTVCSSFSIEKWQEKWKNVLNRNLSKL